VFEQIKKLSGQTLIYGTGHIMARLVTFLLLPLYTNVFTAEEYGVISLAYVFMGFMGVVLHYGLDVALMKKYVQTKDEERTSFFSSAYVSLALTSLIFAICVSLGSDFLAPVILDGNYPKLIVYIGWIIFCDILWSLPQLILRAEEKPTKYIVFSLTNVIATMTLNLVFVLVMKLGIEGVLLSNLIVSGSLLIMTFPIVLKRISLQHISGKHWKTLMTFGLPFLPAGIFSMFMEIADRYLLKWLTDMETVGLYSAGYKLGMLIMLAVMGFNMGWQPFFLKAGSDQKTVFARITTYVLAILGFLWLLLYIWVDDIVRFQIGGISFYGEAYWSSTAIVPVIALGYWFHGVYILQVPGMYLQEKSKNLMIVRAVGALTNILLNIILIPDYGAMGAAWATCSSFAAMAFLIFYMNLQLFPMNYEWGRIIRVIMSIMFVFAMGYTMTDTWVNKLILSTAFPIILYLTGFMTKDERQRLQRLLK
jgi:O-antigen/teichoic acid export membrane protein